MPRARAARTKLSRRRAEAPAPAPREWSPELPYLVLPPVAKTSTADDRGSADQLGADGGARPGGVTSASRTDGGRAEDEPSPRLEDKPPPERTEHTLSSGTAPASDGRRSSSDSGDDDDLLLALSADAQSLHKGDVVTANYRGVFWPALVTRAERKKVTVKFICDLVKFKRAMPFTIKPKVCRHFTYKEKLDCLDVARKADADTAELLRMSLDAVEELEARRASYGADEVEDDPEEFLKTKCDYIVRLRANSASPQKGAVAVNSPCAPLALPLRPLPPMDDTKDEEEEDSERESSSPSPSPPPPPPPLPPHLREEQHAYATRLLKVIEGVKCERRLRAVHARRAPSWRRDAYRSGNRSRLLTACSLGDLESCPELAERARTHALNVAKRLRPRPAYPGIYADEVLAPEAMLFALETLDEQKRSATELDAELALGASRFRV